MIHYHGTPINPPTAAMRVLRGRHAICSFSDPRQVSLAAEVCQSFCLDNGAFTAWKTGKRVDWAKYYAWVEQWRRYPNFDFAIVPDVIAGGEADNDALVEEWPLGNSGVPVWHMHESIERLICLCEQWERVAIGSSGDFAVIATQKWWRRITEAMNAICDLEGFPITKLHGLRMLDPRVFQFLPFTSADSTNVARNIGIDSAWRGTYTPANKETRAVIIAERIEQFNAPVLWQKIPVQEVLFGKVNLEGNNGGETAVV